MSDYRIKGATGAVQDMSPGLRQHLESRGDNLFDVLLETVKVASLGQISEALFEVG